MKIGAVFPTTEIGTDPAVIRDWAQAAEALGYHHILFYDHVLGATHAQRTPPLLGPYDENDAFHEPFVTMGFLAGVTNAIELTNGILILPQRQTVLVAKQAAEVDILSGGRLRLGVGTGWNHVEYESLGMPFEDRGRRFDEQVELLRALFRDRIVDFDGRFHRVDRAGLLPSPRAEIPIWFGGFTEVALRRTARIGDGLIFGSRPTRMKDMLARLRELVAENGRDLASVGADAPIDFSAPKQSWREEIETWRQAGGTHVSLRAMDTAAAFVGERHHGYAGPQAYIDALETFMREVR